MHIGPIVVESHNHPARELVFDTEVSVEDSRRFVGSLPKEIRAATVGESRIEIVVEWNSSWQRESIVQSECRRNAVRRGGGKLREVPLLKFVGKTRHGLVHGAIC